MHAYVITCARTHCEPFDCDLDTPTLWCKNQVTKSKSELNMNANENESNNARVRTPAQGRFSLLAQTPSLRFCFRFRVKVRFLNVDSRNTCTLISVRKSVWAHISLSENVSRCIYAPQNICVDAAWSCVLGSRETPTHRFDPAPPILKAKAFVLIIDSRDVEHQPSRLRLAGEGKVGELQRGTGGSRSARYCCHGDSVRSVLKPLH